MKEEEYIKLDEDLGIELTEKDVMFMTIFTVIALCFLIVIAYAGVYYCIRQLL